MLLIDCRHDESVVFYLLPNKYFQGLGNVGLGTRIKSSLGSFNYIRFCEGTRLQDCLLPAKGSLRPPPFKTLTIQATCDNVLFKLHYYR